MDAEVHVCDFCLRSQFFGRVDLQIYFVVCAGVTAYVGRTNLRLHTWLASCPILMPFYFE